MTTPEQPDLRALKDLTSEELTAYGQAEHARWLTDQAADRAAAGTSVSPFWRGLTSGNDEDGAA